MRTIQIVGMVCGLLVGMSGAQADDAKPVQPTADAAKQAAMEALKRLGSPSEVEPLAGSWTYTAQ